MVWTIHSNISKNLASNRPTILPTFQWHLEQDQALLYKWLKPMPFLPTAATKFLHMSSTKSMIRKTASKPKCNRLSPGRTHRRLSTRAMPTSCIKSCRMSSNTVLLEAHCLWVARTLPAKPARPMTTKTHGLSVSTQTS